MTKKPFLLPISAFALVLLGSWLWLASRAAPVASTPADLPVIPVSQDNDAVKVLPSPVPPLRSSATQSVPFSDALLARDILLDVSKAGPWSEPANPVDIRDYPAW